ncbi:MAG: hypothetical protein JNK67_28570 [Alphaproteobacteria bacterium]|nr:hypothetical protein [Alphaproteobacteria bacterium]
MAALVKGQAWPGSRPLLEVVGTLRPGRHRFSLVVVDSSGRRSAPDIVIVDVRPAVPADLSASPTPAPGRR